MDYSTFGGLGSLFFFIGFLGLLFVLILPVLSAAIAKDSPDNPLRRFRLFSAIAAWWSGLNFAFRQILQGIAVIIGILWWIAVTCSFLALEILIFLDPESVSGSMFPPVSLMGVFGWSVVFLLFTGLSALGKTEFDEGLASKLLRFLKTAALYSCVLLSIIGTILFVLCAVSGTGAALPSLFVLSVISIGSTFYSWIHRV